MTAPLQAGLTSSKSRATETVGLEGATLYMERFFPLGRPRKEKGLGSGKTQPGKASEAWGEGQADPAAWSGGEA